METSVHQAQNVWASIRGTQIQDGDTEENETYLCTQARYYRRKGIYYLIYEESEATGYSGCKTMLTIEGNSRVVMTRTGAVRSNLTLENGNRNIGFYAFQGGELQIGIDTVEMNSTLTDFGGELFCRYRLDINAVPMSENTLRITVQKKAPKGYE